MNDLSSEAKALLERARGEDSPTADDRARVRRALAASIVAAAASGSLPAAAASKSALGAAAGVSSAAAKTSVGLWLAMGVVAGLSGSAALLFGMPGHHPDQAVDARGATAAKIATAPNTALENVPTETPPSGATATTNGAAPSGATATTNDVAPSGATTTTNDVAPSGATTTVNDVTAPGAATTAAVAAATSRGAVPPRSASNSTTGLAPVTAHAAASATGPGTEDSATSATSVTPAQTPASSLGAETALLNAARAALARGDAAGALSLLDEHERQFPRGALTEELLASRVFALCGLGRREDAARSAARLLQLSPESPLRTRVLHSCVYQP